MKIVINKEILVDSLQKILGPTTTKQNFPILSAVFVSCDSETLKLTTTDLDTTIISSQKANIVEPGDIVVPMKRLFSIIRELPSEEITIETTKTNLMIRCGKIEFKIPTLKKEEFPQIQEKKTTTLIQINPQDLEEMIRLTSFCVGYEDVNYVLSGILFEVVEDKIKLISTDGKRLAFMQKTLPTNQPEIKTPLSFILPLRAVSELYKLIKDKEEGYLFTDENKVGFDLGNIRFIARPIEGEFPTYSQYIPNEGKNKLSIERKNLLFALRRANVLSTSDYQGVKLGLKKNTLTIEKQTPQLGEIREELDIDYNGASMDIGFNPNYLIDVLKSIEDEKVCFDFFGADKPAVLRKEDYIYLVLPLKI